VLTRAKKASTPPAVEVADDDVGAAGLAAIAGGLVANPIMIWSLYTLKTTGAGLPPGPSGLLGALGAPRLSLSSPLACTARRWSRRRGPAQQPRPQCSL
jgi:hypothetical protein